MTIQERLVKAISESKHPGAYLCAAMVAEMTKIKAHRSYMECKGHQPDDLRNDVTYNRALISAYIQVVTALLTKMNPTTDDAVVIADFVGAELGLTNQEPKH